MCPEQLGSQEETLINKPVCIVDTRTADRLVYLKYIDVVCPKLAAGLTGNSCIAAFHTLCAQSMPARPLHSQTPCPLRAQAMKDSRQASRSVNQGVMLIHLLVAAWLSAEGLGR